MAPREYVSNVVCSISAVAIAASARADHVLLDTINVTAGPSTVTRLTPKQLLSMPPKPSPAVL